jgi:hypothetical protein
LQVEDCEGALALNSEFWKAGARAGKALMMMGEYCVTEEVELAFKRFR